jgi:ATPase subunit of ABC transporter with duplicated ATPase domains
MARQFIYHMQGLSKTYPGNRKILEDINLSFYPDAKIGVLGVNGSGKSTLLRIMAGIDTEFAGEAWAAEGARVGYLEQEPQLDASKSRGERDGGCRSAKGSPSTSNCHELLGRDRGRDDTLQDEIEAKGRISIQRSIGGMRRCAAA